MIDTVKPRIKPWPLFPGGWMCQYSWIVGFGNTPKRAYENWARQVGRFTEAY